MPCYQNCRADIQNGDLLLFAGHGLFSSIIRWRTSSRITHAGIAAWWHGRLMVLEAVNRVGVRVYPLSEYLRRRVTVYWFALNPAYKRIYVVRRALSHVGQRYANWQQFIRSWGLGVCKRLLRLPDDTDEDRFFCSEMAIVCLQAGASPESPVQWYVPSKTSPGDIALDCFKLGLISMGVVAA